MWAGGLLPLTITMNLIIKNYSLIWSGLTLPQVVQKIRLPGLLDVDRTCLHVTIDRPVGTCTSLCYPQFLNFLPEAANCAGNYPHKMVYTIELLQNTDDWYYIGIREPGKAWQRGLNQTVPTLSDINVLIGFVLCFKALITTTAILYPPHHHVCHTIRSIIFNNKSGEFSRVRSQSTC